MKKFEKECRAYAERVGLLISFEGDVAVFRHEDRGGLSLLVEWDRPAYCARIGFCGDVAMARTIEWAVKLACTLHGESQAQAYRETYADGAQ